MVDEQQMVNGFDSGCSVDVCGAISKCIIRKDCLGVLGKEAMNSFIEELACLVGSVRGLAY